MMLAVDDPTSLIWWFQQFGFPGLVLCLIFLGGRGIWLFLKPYFQTILEGHIALIGKATEAFDSMPLKAEVATKSEVIEIGKDVKDIKLKVGSDGNMIAEIHKVLVPKETHIRTRNIPAVRRKEDDQ